MFEAFEQAGPIGAISYAGFSVEQQEYRIAPGAKLKSFDSSRRRLSDFRPGDVIVFTGKVIGGVKQTGATGEVARQDFSGSYGYVMD